MLDQLEASAGLSVPKGSLRDDAAATRERLDEAVQANPEHLAMLRTLESRHDEMTQAGPGPDAEIPSADELAAEVEEFLRDQKPDE